MTASQCEVLIIGAGPIGIELAVGLQRAGIPYAHLDAAQIGSTIAWYAPQTHFFSSPERIAIAGVPLQTLDQTKATREEYLNYLRAVVLQFDLRIETYEPVTSIERREDGAFLVKTAGRTPGERIAGKVILAIGDMHRPRLLGVPGEELPHVSHYFADPHLYFRRRVLIVGGRNSAVEAAIRCVRVGAAEVALSYRGTDFDDAHIKFWLLPEVRGMVRDGRLTFLPRTTVREIRPEGAVLDPDGRSIDADVVLLLTGYEQDKTLFEQAGVVLEGPRRRPRFDERTMETNVPGLYVAGTAVAGTQASGVKAFIETSHVHVERILAALTGARPPADEAAYEMPES
ncbi:MAG TPA: NAD(P)-binding domain-containing protein [Thermoanaerobaculia bacterium]|nr:NAD(P)-binding domain-containing protein [Thermoanaerobaculia bacterium]